MVLKRAIENAGSHFKKTHPDINDGQTGVEKNVKRKKLVELVPFKLKYTVLHFDHQDTLNIS